MNHNHSGTADGDGWRHISSQPWLHQQGAEVQEFGTIRQRPLGLPRDTRLYGTPVIWRNSSGRAARPGVGDEWTICTRAVPSTWTTAAIFWPCQGGPAGRGA
jgi:hypothetical protein